MRLMWSLVRQISGMLALTVGLSAHSLAMMNDAAASQQSAAISVLSEREQAQLIDQLLQQRLEQLLPALMTRSNIDMWLLISREYNEDPVLKTMLPATWLSARRRTMLVIVNPGDGQPLQRYAVARYDVGSAFKKAWDTQRQPDQWQALVDLIKRYNPKRIGINQSQHFGHADGMVASELTLLQQSLGPELAKRLVSAEPLAVGWLESRTQAELQHYRQLTQWGHQLIAQAFSNQLVTPGKTTTDDVVWWLRQRATQLGLAVWFHPTVSIQRASSGQFDQIKAFSAANSAANNAAKPDNVIQPGDLLHVDFGLTYLRLNSDQQQHAYVLKPGETDAPAALKQALAQGNLAQDLLTAQFKTGRSGNQLLAGALAAAKAKGLKATIYSHPIGHHGHAAGPTIGMWDNQQGIPGSGDYPLYPNTAYSIELNVALPIEGFNADSRVMLEEDGYFDGTQFHFFNGRQTRLHLINSASD